jgi:hypothetical protein
MPYLKLLLIASVLLLFACGGATEPATTSTTDEAPTAVVKAPTTSPKTALKIVGKNVNLRDKPSTEGKIVGKLDNGAACELQEKSDYIETISNKTDFWLKIKQGTIEGWVFGAFTDYRLTNYTEVSEMTYLGAEQGDLMHIIFGIAKGQKGEWRGSGLFSGDQQTDFSFPFKENSFGSFNFVDEKKMETASEGTDISNKALVNKKFKVTWQVLNTDVYDFGKDKTVAMEVPICRAIELLK